MNQLEYVKHLSIDDYAYHLPEERIARYPVSPRDSSKLLVYRDGQIQQGVFRDLPDCLPERSLLVCNNTKVIRARLFFRKETGASIEIFCLEPFSPADYARSFQSEGSCEWLCLVGNLKKWKQGRLVRELDIDGRQVRFEAEQLGQYDKNQRIRFSWTPSDIRFASLLEAAGTMPIPPYLNRETEQSDERNYQTVYSRIEGSVAAPTAGLHFTPEVLKAIESHQITRRELTLHVSASTFQPVKSEQMEGHPMHLEYILADRSLIEALVQAEGRIVAVGTTSVRTIESLYWFGVHFLEQDGSSAGDEWVLDQWYPYQAHADYSLKTALNALLAHLDQTHDEVFHAATRLLIAPSYRFRAVDAMLTNFHQPKSTLLLLVSAFVGDDWRTIYQYALQNDFRFLSYGDSSLLFRCDAPPSTPLHSNGV